MHVRKANLDEASTIAWVGTQAFQKDPSYGHFYPWKDYFPEDFFMHLRRKYQRLMATPGCCIIALVLDKEDEQPNKTRPPTAPAPSLDLPHSRGLGAPTNSEMRVVRHMLDLAEATEPPNRAASQEALDDFWRQELIGHNSTEFTDKIDFYTLAMLPEYQRKGCAGHLFAWLFEASARDNVPVFGDASAKAIRIYCAVGAVIIGKIMQEETTYERTLGNRVLPSIKVPRLETPVIRWDRPEQVSETLAVYLRSAQQEKAKL
ncbi:unnamed protein product [Clonostachys rhizophaga]|uniref:N-acetyltransferase domain-containing protein n=1 Tax=Clonostachys rhizophaga TaxID=160324 RepID=A0A9N9VFI3_9HYPO|nr:unnamed protein product [Clonostachys rhizophaga]